MEMKTSCILVMTAVIMLKRSANGMGLPLNKLTYIISGSHLKWTEPGDRLRATESGEYVARNVVPARLAMRHDGTMYLAMPRFKNGVPFTLGTIEYDPCQSTIEPPISPYPCEAAHRPNQVPKNWTLVNVVDVYLDDNGLLWTLDLGRVNMLDAVAVVRPPMVFAFDTENDQMVQAIDLSCATIATSCLQSIVVDQQHVYISDTGQGNIIVYNMNNDRTFKVHVPAGTCGRRDVMYMALAVMDSSDESTANGPSRYRRMYVTYLSSCDMLYVPLHAIEQTMTTLPTVKIGRKPCKMIVLGTDRASTMYFRTGDNSDILSWNTKTQFRMINFKFVHHGKKSRVPLMVTLGFHGFQWVMESNFIDFLIGDIGCLGVSTRIRLLRKREVDDDDDLCSINTTGLPMPCGDDLGTTTEHCGSTPSAINRNVPKITTRISAGTTNIIAVN